MSSVSGVAILEKIQSGPMVIVKYRSVGMTTMYAAEQVARAIKDRLSGKEDRCDR